MQLQHYISENAETVSVNLHYGHCSLSQLIPFNRQAYHPLIEVLNSNLHRSCEGPPGIKFCLGFEFCFSRHKQTRLTLLGHVLKL